jgi:hypothetical protein
MKSQRLSASAAALVMAAILPATSFADVPVAAESAVVIR